jgi:nucleoside-diphosphate-sugar epimerase
MKITIIACGWLGLPLGQDFVKLNYDVKGSVTNSSKIEKLYEAGIQPFLLNINPNINCDNFTELIDSEIIIINIPPRTSKNGSDYYFTQMVNLINEIKKSFEAKVLPIIIFISSTSVYPDANQIADETSEVEETSVLVKVENLYQKSFEKIIILRFGGLMGYDRFPGKYYAGKPFENWASGVNYVHRDDAINIIEKLILNNIQNGIFNVCSPIHPSRKEIITKNCSDLKIELPIFITPAQPIPYKIISSTKLIEAIDYEFKYANPLDFFYQKEN